MNKELLIEKLRMHKKWVALAALVLLLLVPWVIYNATKKSSSGVNAPDAKAEGAFYWTCPMHPQVHQDHPGECPICHMKLVKVSTQPQEQAQGAQGEKRSAVQVTQNQLELVGVQKQEVEKMSLKAVIPVSGRLISSTAVAFQVYEKDLRYVRRGLPFKGEISTESEDEVTGVIGSVDSIVDPTSRTVRVVGQIAKGPSGVIAETSFRGEIKIELKDTIAIPESSVLHTGQGDLVYLVGASNKLTPKNVKLGIKAEGFYEVLGGLNPGDVISSGPNFLIDSEAKIRGAND